MDEKARTTGLLLFSLIRGVDCYKYDILGLVASSTCAIFLFLIVIFVGVFAAVWSYIVTKHYEKRGIKKSPRKSTIKRAHRNPTRSAIQSDAELQIAAQQRMRPKLPNTWREMRQQQQQNGASHPRENIISSTSFQNNDYYFTGEVLSNGGQTAPTADPQEFTIVTELEDIQRVDHVPSSSVTNVNGAVHRDYIPSAEIRGVNRESLNSINANTMNWDSSRVSSSRVPVRIESATLEREKVTQF